MPKIIHIEDVKLKSMSVEIKALTVSGKQMTLSVFRQIPERRIWDDNLSILGVPWGKVIYFWGDEKDCNGFQVVWQDNDVIYRSIHWKPVNNWYSSNERHTLSSYARKALDRIEGHERRLKEWDTLGIKTTEYINTQYASNLKEYQEAMKKLNEKDQYWEDRFSRLKKAHKNLEALPQLFIAL